MRIYATCNLFCKYICAHGFDCSTRYIMSIIQGWPVAGGRWQIPAWTILPKVAFTGIYKYFIDFSSNYIVNSPSYSLYNNYLFQTPAHIHNKTQP